MGGCAGCNYFGNHRLVSQRVFNDDHAYNRKLLKHSKPSIFLQNSINPNSLSTSQITTVYKVPSKQFQTDIDVIKHHGFDLMRVLGSGGFAVVYLAKHRNTGIQVACKKMHIGDGSHPYLMLDMKNELYVMETVDHPFIVRMYKHFIVNDHLYLFMQFANGGTLSKFIQLHGPLSESDCLVPFAQLLSGVAHMHKLHIAHRDLKLCNVLLLKNDFNEYNVLLTDFGLSRVAWSNKNGIILNKTYCGTAVYMAPEIDGHTKYNAFLVDVWALGVMLFVMVNYKYPFETSNSHSLANNHKKMNWEFSPYITTPSKKLTDLLNQIFQPNPRKRASLRRVTKHEWVADEYARVNTLAKQLSKS